MKHEFMETEGFVSIIGDIGSNELNFFNTQDFSLMQKLDLSQEGCVHLCVHSRSHFSIMMVSTNGSLFLWNMRPAKIIQPLAPFFTEIDENIEYVEREDEFEEEITEEDILFKSLPEDERKKRKFALNDIDFETVSNTHSCSYAQASLIK